MKPPNATIQARRTIMFGLLGAWCAMIASCSTVTAQREAIRPVLQTDSYGAALERIKPLDTDDSRLLYFYERGLILRSYGYYEQSNDALDRAERLLEDLYTRSVTREAASLIVGDYLRAYRGERFEASMLHYYKILNYLDLGLEQEAAVESRRLDHRLQVLRDEGRSFDATEAFLQYLTGLVYMQAALPAEADVSLRLALDAYDRLMADDTVEMPASLLCDLAINATRLGRLTDAAGYRERGACAPPGSTDVGTVRVLLECGHVPFKYEQSLFLPILESDRREDLERDTFTSELIGRRGLEYERRRIKYLMKVALPALKVSSSPIAYARVTAVGGEGTVMSQARTVVGADLGGTAVRSFEEHQGEILLRATTRALAKYMAASGPDKEEDEARARLANLLGVMTEEADTRCWSALPDRILLATLKLPPGSHTIEVELFGNDRQRIAFLTLTDVQIVSGGSTIVSHRVY